VNLDGVRADHVRVLLDGLPIFERHGLLPAGGHAFRAQGFPRERYAPRLGGSVWLRVAATVGVDERMVGALTLIRCPFH
jgi:hypothetical protein